MRLTPKRSQEAFDDQVTVYPVSQGIFDFCKCVPKINAAATCIRLPWGIELEVGITSWGSNKFQDHVSTTVNILRIFQNILKLLGLELYFLFFLLTRPGLQ